MWTAKNHSMTFHHGSIASDLRQMPPLLGNTIAKRHAGQKLQNPKFQNKASAQVLLRLQAVGDGDSAGGGAGKEEEFTVYGLQFTVGHCRAGGDSVAEVVTGMCGPEIRLRCRMAGLCIYVFIEYASIGQFEKLPFARHVSTCDDVFRRVGGDFSKCPIGIGCVRLFSGIIRPLSNDADFSNKTLRGVVELLAGGGGFSSPVEQGEEEGDCGGG